MYVNINRGQVRINAKPCKYVYIKNGYRSQHVTLVLKQTSNTNLTNQKLKTKYSRLMIFTRIYVTCVLQRLPLYNLGSNKDNELNCISSSKHLMNQNVVMRHVF